MTAEPVTRAEAETILSKMTQHKCRTLVIEEVPDPFEQTRREMVQDMLAQAAKWRDLPGSKAKRIVFTDENERLLWLVGERTYAGMQISPSSGRPVVLNPCPFSKEQLDGAVLAFDLCPERLLGNFKPVEFGHYCELAAKGCETAAQFLEEALTA